MSRHYSTTHTLRGLLGTRSTSLQPAPQPHVLTPATPTPSPLDSTAQPQVQNIKVKRRVGGLRGGITGFLLGMTVAGALGYGYLLEDYERASTRLHHSVQDLSSSTTTVTEHVRRLASAERDLARLKRDLPTREEMTLLRQEMHKTYAGCQAEVLDLKAQLVQVEVDLARLARGHGDADGNILDNEDA